MRVETLTNEPSQLNDYTLTPERCDSYAGTPSKFPVLIDVRDEQGALAYRLHLTAEDAAQLAPFVHLGETPAN